MGESKIDEGKLLRALCLELANNTLEELIEMAENPRFEEMSRVMDWRTYVVNIFDTKDKIRVKTETKRWLRKPLEERIVRVAVGRMEAGREEWD